MKFLSGLLAGVGVAAGAVFFWRKYHTSVDTAVSQAAGEVSSWSETAAAKTGEAARQAAGEVSSWSETAAEDAGETTDKIADEAGEAVGRGRGNGS
jgi:hypothetical protein